VNDTQSADPMSTEELDFFSARSEMGALMRAHDWASTPLGPPAAWPQSLKTVVRILLTSRFAMWMAWGPKLTFLCNDAYRPTLGVKGEWALGASSKTVWAEIWPDIGPRIDSVLRTGVATYDENLLLFLERSGYPEETYHTFSYSPLADDGGKIVGMLCVVTEVSERVIGERRLALLRDLSALLAPTQTETAVFAALAKSVSGEHRDLPFTLAYLFDGESRAARLTATTGSATAHSAALAALDPGSDDAWSADRIRTQAQPQPLIAGDLERRFAGAAPLDTWGKPMRNAVVVPLTQQGQSRSAGFIVIGLNAYRPYDADYSGFVELLAGQIAASLASARAYEEERRRAEALAEIDRAKTAFFSNVSHEFRTPLTLMLGPLEECLADPDCLSEPHRLLIEVVHRNGLRLLKLVNSLLDFSRMEAGRSQANFLPTDLGALTAEMASNFRAACERAGLRLEVDCASLPPVYVDRDMWEKIVLNLLSNAFKFTFGGAISVTVRALEDAAELIVSDTGTGIPAHELPRLFERFHRIEGARGRSFEGSGIGLALIQELVKLHHGTIRVDSIEGQGTTFTIAVPFGVAHLPAERVGVRTDMPLSAARSQAYVEEALRWLPGDPAITGRLSEDSRNTLQDTSHLTRARIVLADDNSDMRDYTGRLLAASHSVESFADGAAALAAIRAQRPDLLISDIMMPVLDGFGLLRAIRDDAQLRDLPVILLSARAGEEARIEGLTAGADDYLVKPFSARELIARVDAALTNARLRRESANALRSLHEQLEIRFAQRTAERDRMWRLSQDLMVVVGFDGSVAAVNPAWTNNLGWQADELIGRDALALMHPDDRYRGVRALGQLVRGNALMRYESRCLHKDGSSRWFSWTAVPDDKQIHAVGRDISAEKESAEALQKIEEQLRQAQKMEAIGKLTGGVAHDFNNLLQVIGGNLQLLAGDVQGNERAEQRLRNALGGVLRGAKLAAQLLAFARRQALEPKVINLGRFLRGLDDMLRRALGEEVEIETVIGGGLWNILVDPAQVENALLNLAINARDAMRGRGRLTVEVGNASLDDAYAAQHTDVSSGQYVMLAVTDTGCGMSPDLIERVFEPFFTTKPEGQGTGLGLSMVYGFVKQSGGHIKIYSEPNQGTAIRIYLPRVMQAEDVAAEIDSGPISGGSETILVVEDDDAVRTTVVGLLGDLGYRVLKASDAQSALAIVESGVPIDLLFTDVVMPGPLRSPQLARAARERLPHIAVLFTSGYTDNAIVHGGRLDAGTNLLSKPYSREALARKIRHVIANQRHRDSLVPASGPAAAKTNGGESMKKVTILLTEDDEAIRRVTGEALSLLGYSVIEAQDATQALAALQESPVDILLSDVGLPGMSGAQLAITACDLLPKLVVVFASGRDSVPGIEGHRLATEAMHLRKPFDIVELQAAMKAAEQRLPA
jgi:PAS domain S-box-containing protein